VDASRSFQWLHDRMPAFLFSEEAVDEWLGPKRFAEVRSLLRPAETGLRWWPVTDRVGKISYQEPDATKPIDVARARGASSIDRFVVKRPKVGSAAEGAAGAAQGGAGADAGADQR